MQLVVLPVQEQRPWPRLPSRPPCSSPALEPPPCCSLPRAFEGRPEPAAAQGGSDAFTRGARLVVLAPRRQLALVLRRLRGGDGRRERLIILAAHEAKAGRATHAAKAAKAATAKAATAKAATAEAATAVAMA